MSAERFSIRSLRPEDFFLLNNGMDWAPLPKDRDSVFLLVALDHAPISFVAEDGDGRPLGVLIAVRSSDGRAAYVLHVRVEEPARGRGIGSALLARFEDAARALGVTRLWLFADERNRAFYERRGWRVLDEGLPAEVASYIRDVKNMARMVKDL